MVMFLYIFVFVYIYLYVHLHAKYTHYHLIYAVWMKIVHFGSENIFFWLIDLIDLPNKIPRLLRHRTDFFKQTLGAIYNIWYV